MASGRGRRFSLLPMVAAEFLRLVTHPKVFLLCQQHCLAGNAIPDAWIAAAVLANHDHLVSFDQGFRQLLRPHQLTLLRS